MSVGVRRSVESQETHRVPDAVAREAKRVRALLDTNVISAVMLRVPDTVVVDWLESAAARTGVDDVNHRVVIFVTSRSRTQLHVTAPREPLCLIVC